MSEVPREIRHEAAILARRKNARSVEFSRQAPCDWRPQTVVNPEDGMPFTPDGAWEYVAEKLEDGNQRVTWVELRKPPGKKACQMIVPGSERNVYIKFQLGAGKIKGRSFHYCTE